ncbi:MAG: hypothetical protein GEU82_12420 [Luteitalea sp.]|nr:hypothetical protein [Luteitalea sp.]
MIRSRTAAAATLCLTLASAWTVHADVRADQRTRFELAGVLGRVVNIFGGKGARDGVESTVAVKGSRKSTISGGSGQIIDLTEEKVYNLDLKKKTYTVTTFAELRRQMEDAKKKAEDEARKAQAEPQKDGGNEPDPNEARKAAAEVEVDFDVKNTGETRTVNGFDTRQAIMTVTVREKGKTLEQSGGLVGTTEIWLAPRMAAMSEVQEFDVRYAQMLSGPMVAGASPQDIAAAMAMYPQMQPALERLRAEGSKLEGTPILTTITLDAVKSAEQMAAEKQPSASDSRPPTTRGIGGLLGGLARAARKEDEPKPRATFLTTSVEVLKLTTEVAAADVAIPAGFTESR